MKIRILIALLLSSLLFACQNEEPWSEVHSSGKYIPVDSLSLAYQDSAMLAKIAPYKKKLDLDMDSVIAYSNKEYFKKKPNGILNNLVCDMVFDVISKRFRDSDFKPDFCLLNYGGLRRPIPKGAITKSNIFQLMPFQNESVICRLSGTQMNKMFEYLKKSGGQPIANMKVYYKGDDFEKAIINSDLFDSSKTYNVLTSDYTAKGGDRMDFFLQADTMINCGSLLRDDIFTYIRSLKDHKLTGNEEKRIFFE